MTYALEIALSILLVVGGLFGQHSIVRPQGLQRPAEELLTHRIAQTAQRLAGKAGQIPGLQQQLTGLPGQIARQTSIILEIEHLRHQTRPPSWRTRKNSGPGPPPHAATQSAPAA